MPNSAQKSPKLTEENLLSHTTLCFRSAEITPGDRGLSEKKKKGDERKRHGILWQLPEEKSQGTKSPRKPKERKGESLIRLDAIFVKKKKEKKERTVHYQERKKSQNKYFYFIRFRFYFQ